MLRATKRFISAIRIGLGVFVASLLFSTTVSAGPPEKADVLLLSDFTTVVGEAMLVRTPNGVNVKVWTTGLDPSAVYTVWWLIDIFGPGACVMWATGHPIGPNGTGQFSAHLKEGVPWTEDEPSPANGGAGPCDGLTDAQAQLVGVVLRTHGPKIPGRVYDQMSTYFGGCDPDNPDDPNVCVDQQIALFP